SWEPWRACGRDPRTMTMVSSATYTALDPRRPAVLSPATYRHLRRMGVRAPVITDALEAGALRRHARLASRAVDAGATFLLTTDHATATALRREMSGAIRSRRLSLRKAQAALTRSMSYRRGLVSSF